MPHLRRLAVPLLVLGVLLAPVPSRAQGWGAIDMSIPMANTGYLLAGQIAASTIDPSDGTATDADTSGGTDAGTVIARTPVSRSQAPDTLAAAYPPEARAQATELFRQLLASYDPLVGQLGQDADDYAVAAAVFVAGSYSAYRGEAVDDRAFGPLVRDLRARIEVSPAFHAAPLADKQAAFDQFAILGIMAALVPASAQQMPPGAERDRLEQSARAAGARYLEETFGVPAAQVTIDAQGLRY
ncbi:MAG: hypothetical protein MUF73_11760 [Rhodobacteraceae bacterium]|jgi:hypothetical protein|nr:hypothetical protein [Paracoccaceae bacterium]